MDKRIMLSRELIEYIFSQHDDSGLCNALHDILVRNGNAFSVDIAEALDNAIEARIERSVQPLTAWIVSLTNSQHLLPRFLYGRFLVRQGHYAKAVEILKSVAESLPKADPFLLLHIVRLLVRLKHYAQAAESLRLALSLYPPYSFLVKSEKILEKILASGEWKPLLSIKIALIGSSTTTFLTPVLRAACFKIGISADIYEGEYGNYRQDILNTESTLYAFEPQTVILLLNHHDLSLTPLTHPNTAQQVAEDLRNLWALLIKQHPCHIIQVGFDLPPYGSWGCLEETEPGGRVRIVNTINTLLSEALPAGVSFCNMDRIAQLCGENFHSDIEWYSAKQYPSLEALPTLADHLVSHLRAAFGYSKKVLVLDLDNTLWGGVIGEDGLSGIVLGPPSPEGESYLDLQRYLKELKERGVLLCVCSKNNSEDAESPFKEHDSMILHLDDFVLFTANWRDKASNLREMAERLSLGLNSFVFIDDNPLERAWIRSQLPEVIVPEYDGKPWEILAALRRGRYFETIALTPEDSERHKSYKSNLARQELEKTYTNIEDFLAGLEMVAERGPVDAATLTRVTQLINKTNQFNLTTKRYSEEQIRQIANSTEWWSRWYRLKDKFGDHGIIGVILVNMKDKIWHVDTWLMSCRVLGRQMEEFMLAELLDMARTNGVHEVHGKYIPTAKNVLVKDIYTRLGFTEAVEPNNFIFNLSDMEIPQCKFIRSTEEVSKD